MSEVVYLRMVVNHEVHNLSNLIKELELKKRIFAALAALALATSVPLAFAGNGNGGGHGGGGHNNGGHNNGGHGGGGGGCGGYGQSACNVPEPGSLALVGLAGLAYFIVSRRRATKSQT